MFDQLVVSSARGSKTNKPWTVALSASVQFIILGILILIPLIYTEALPNGMLSTFLVAPAPPPPPPPPAAAVKEVVRPRIVQPEKMVAPTVIPKKVVIEKDAAPDLGGGVAGGVGVIGGTGPLGGIIGGPPPPPRPAVTGPVRVGGNVMAAKAIDRPNPEYPAIAKAAHVQGTIVLHAIISKDGAVQDLQYISGPPLLMKAAMDAVRQWRYKPTELNGEPVEVDTTIQVIFTLGD
jgi:protein TonB